MAAEALGSLCEVGNDQVVGALISALGDQDWAVRKAATQALGRLLTEGECKDKVVQVCF